MKTLCTPARIFTLALLAVLAGATLTPAQAQFSYTNFSSTTGLQLNGSAASVVNTGEVSVLRLTPGSANQDGSAWYTTQIPLASGFTSTFTFQFTGEGGSGGHADGIAFVIQAAPAGVNARGEQGGAIGYGDDDGNASHSLGIPNSVAIELDTFQNGWDPNNNHIAVMSCGAGNNSQHHGLNGCASGADPTKGINSTFATNLTDGNMHTVIVTYGLPCDGCQNLTVQLDGQQVLAVAFDLATLGLDTNDDAYVGFTGSTGGGFENQDILSWSFSAQTIVEPVSSTAPTTFVFANTLSHTVDFSQAAENSNLTYPNNDPATIQIQSTNTIIDPATWPQYVTGGPLATSLLFPLVNDNPGGVGPNGSLFVDLCFDPTLTGNAAIPLDTNCPFASSASSFLLGIQIAANVSSKPMVNNPVNTGLTTALAHYEPNNTGTTTWAPSPTNGTANPACSITFGSSTSNSPQKCDVLDIQQSIYGDPTSSGKTKSKGAFAMIYNVPMPLSSVSVNGTAVNAPPSNNNGFSAGLWFKSPLNLNFVVNPACPLNPPTWPCTLPSPDTLYNYFNPAPVAGETFDVTDLSGNVLYPAPPTPSPAQAVPPTGFNTQSVQQITFPGTSNQVGLADGKYFLQWGAADNVGISEQNVQLITGTGATCPNPAGGTFSAPCYQTGTFQAQVNVDSTLPQIAGPTLSPAPATYNGVPNAYLFNQIAIGTYSCSDPLTNGVASGIATCTDLSGGKANTSVIGNNSFTVNATDVAGNTTSSSASYTVVDQPVDLDTGFFALTTTVKPGSKVAYIVGVVNEAKKNIAYAVTLMNTVTLPAGASIVSITPGGGTCSILANVITCRIAALAPLNTFSAAGALIVVNVPKTTTSGQITNHVSVTSLNRDLDNDGSKSLTITVKN
jgi:hypothetical protein